VVNSSASSLRRHPFLPSQGSGTRLLQRCFLLLLLVLQVTATLLGQEGVPKDGYKAAQKDAKGIIWAIPKNQRGCLFRFDGRNWSREAAPFPESSRAIANEVFLLSDGTVACFWGWDTCEFAVTHHRGAESRLLAKGHNPLFTPALPYPPLEDSQKGLWFTGYSPEIVYVKADGQVKNYTIQPEYLINPSKPLHNPVHATEDGRGRIWIWSRYRSHSGARIRGALLIDGEEISHINPASEIPEPFFYGIIRKDASHLWLVMEEVGMFETDINTLESKKLPTPEPEGFHYPQTIFSSGSDLYYMGPLPDNRHTLWRYRDGKWVVVLNAVDERGSLPEERTWTRTSQGIILCSYGAPPWYIPDNGTPVRLNWRYRFPLAEATCMYQLPDNSFFALSRRGEVFHGSLLIPPPPEPALRVQDYNILGDCILDSDGDAWTILSEKDKALSHWNGKQWSSYPLPQEFRARPILAVDSQRRVWAFPSVFSMNPSTAFFDSKSEKWIVFPTIENAFESVKTDLPQFPQGHPWGLFCALSGDHQRIAFRWVNKIVYYDGTQWHSWKDREITGKSCYLGAPFFDKEERLCVGIYADVWKLDAQCQWQLAKEEKAPPEYRESRSNPPEECPAVSSDDDSGAYDNKGAYWAIRGQQLYKCLMGNCVKLFADREPHPFIDGRKIRKVWMDRSRNTLFLTEAQNDSGSRSLVRIPTKNLPPQPGLHISVIPTEEAVAKIKLRTQSEAKLLFRWQLDAGPWQWTEKREITTPSLLNGPHAITVEAFNEELESIPKPVIAQFEIKKFTVQQIKAFITRLDDRDFEKRKAAIKALSRQPDDALPALKTARPTANDDQRWWIDAAIQQIERNQRAQGKSL